MGVFNGMDDFAGLNIKEMQGTTFTSESDISIFWKEFDRNYVINGEMFDSLAVCLDRPDLEGFIRSAHNHRVIRRNIYSSNYSLMGDFRVVFNFLELNFTSCLIFGEELQNKVVLGAEKEAGVLHVS